jgi:hypothetical protein
LDERKSRKFLESGTEGEEEVAPPNMKKRPSVVYEDRPRVRKSVCTRFFSYLWDQLEIGGGN